MTIRGYEIGAKAIAIVVAALVAAGVVWAAVHYWEKSRSLGAQSRMEHGQAQAASNSAADAIGTVARSGKRETASEDLTRSNEKEIRNAQGANDPVNPAVRDAGLRALCRRAAYRDDPKCRVQQPHP